MNQNSALEQLKFKLGEFNSYNDFLNFIETNNIIFKKPISFSINNYLSCQYFIDCETHFDLMKENLIKKIPINFDYIVLTESEYSESFWLNKKFNCFVKDLHKELIDYLENLELDNDEYTTDYIKEFIEDYIYRKNLYIPQNTVCYTSDYSKWFILNYKKEYYTKGELDYIKYENIPFLIEKNDVFNINIPISNNECEIITENSNVYFFTNQFYPLKLQTSKQFVKKYNTEYIKINKYYFNKNNVDKKLLLGFKDCYSKNIIDTYNKIKLKPLNTESNTDTDTNTNNTDTNLNNKNVDSQGFFVSFNLCII